MLRLAIPHTIFPPMKNPIHDFPYESCSKVTRKAHKEYSRIFILILLKKCGIFQICLQINKCKDKELHKKSKDGWIFFFMVISDHHQHSILSEV